MVNAEPKVRTGGAVRALVTALSEEFIGDPGERNVTGVYGKERMLDGASSGRLTSFRTG